MQNVLSCLFVQGDRFAANKDITNRKLLWHGTNVAVVAAILKSGLRIMPHSGGRVGRGIYFASENSKSAGYGKLSLFMLCEQAFCCLLWLSDFTIISFAYLI
jgi:Poly(ADP-ribose) polymerase catalytic domain